MPAQFKGIIFDFDGTLADTLPICLEAFRRAAKPYRGRDLSDQEILATFGPSDRGAARVLAPEDPEACLESFHSFYADLHLQIDGPFEGVRRVLDGLRANGIKLGMVTGKGERSLGISMRKLGLENEFEQVECGCDDGPCKPEGIRKITDAWGFAPDEVLYVGDSTNDVRSARAAGVQMVSAVWADPARVSIIEPLKPDWLFTRFSDFVDWLRDQHLLNG